MPVLIAVNCLLQPIGCYICHASSVPEVNTHITEKEHVELAAALARVPTTKEQCPRMEFESYTTFEPLPYNSHGDFTKWTFYFHRTDYKVNIHLFLIEFISFTADSFSSHFFVLIRPTRWNFRHSFSAFS